ISAAVIGTAGSPFALELAPISGLQSHASASASAAPASSAGMPKIFSTLPIVLRPHEHAVLGPIVFSPKSVGAFRSTLLLKNNLTHLSSIYLHGIGARGELLFTVRANVGLPHILSLLCRPTSSRRRTRGMASRGAAKSAKAAVTERRVRPPGPK